jgi:large subunit ribosomal protein L21
MKFAVIKTGGKQYLVSEGQELVVEKLEHETGTVSFTDVLLVVNDATVSVGQPLVAGAKVTATVVDEGRGEKKLVFRYKAKIRYKKKKGHRQPYTTVKIEKIHTK